MRISAPTIAASFLCLTLLGLGPARAQEEGEGAAAPPPTAGASQEGPQGLKAVVRGLFVETRLGVGYMVIDDDVKPDQFNPNITGSEKLGAGSAASVAVGFDVTEAVALQALVGATFASGHRSNQVRDLSMFYGGAAARINFGLSERLFFVATPGVAYVSADNAVEEPDAGVAVIVDVGVEYFVHVRHLSVGLTVNGFVPISPMRAYVGISPTLKYTF